MAKKETNKELSVQVLVSTMNQIDNHTLQKNMNIASHVVINQCSSLDKTPKNVMKNGKKFLSFKERGLSRSRNRALNSANADICIIADDDMTYVDNYESVVIESYKKHPDADILAFDVYDENVLSSKKNLKPGKINLITSMKINSVRITFKRESVLGSGIVFNESFGSGSKYYMGEENIFLSECLKKGLKIYFVPRKIATLGLSDPADSSWFNGYDDSYFKVKGAVFYKMSPTFFLFFITQFAIRKYQIYKNSMGLWRAAYLMSVGAFNIRSSGE